MNKISLIALLISTLNFCQISSKDNQGFIYTVSGKIPAAALKFSLTHEHIMSNFGAEAAYVPDYDSVQLFEQVVPYLKRVKSLGVTSIFDCTTAYFGRDVRLLKALADVSGVQIITNTGIYGAANDRYVPAFAYEKSEQEIAGLWKDEFENGIDATGIKPGFIKLAFDNGEPSEIDIKLFKAGILTHLATGLTIAVHTGNNPKAASQQLQLLKEYNVDASAWIWVHANKIENQNLLIDAASQGAWISLDGVNENNFREYLQKLKLFKKENLLHKVLLSHDGNSFPRGRAIRKYESISTNLIPGLLKQGFTQEDINQLMIKNPIKAFQITDHEN